MLGRPSGTVTFLFTEVEGSTQLWEQYPETIKSAVAWHDALIQRVIEARGGYVFKTVGNTFCAAFATPSSALLAALDAQRALLHQDWGGSADGDPPFGIKVRMALHTGAAEERDGDYLGPSVNRVSRILSTAHGGQVLLSFSATQLVRELLPEDVYLRDLGEYRLRGLTQPERIHQLVAPDLPADFPPPRVLGTRLTNLHPPRTPFVGRSEELAAVQDYLLKPAMQLVTLTGVGGTGKTRLAVQVAAELLEDLDDGVFFVDLTPHRPCAGCRHDCPDARHSPHERPPGPRGSERLPPPQAVASGAR